MFITRFISGCFLIAVTVGVLLAGGIPLLLVNLGISLIGLFELYRVFGIEKDLLGITGYGMAVVYYFALLFMKQINVLFLMIYLLVWMGIYVLQFPKYDIKEVVLAYFGVLYVSVLFSCLYLVRQETGGVYLTGLIFIGAWGCDTWAYCIGKLFGFHKLAPVLSPKKSVEGAIGGVVGAMILGLLYATLVASDISWKVDWNVFCVLASGLCAIFSQIGDLTASGIKRNHCIKDYGTLIPGHGGILDRFDSILFAGAVMWSLCGCLG